MPLIGAKLHVLNTVWKKKKPREGAEASEDSEEKPALLVAETQEICSSADELKRKNTLYAANIWTCRVTGKPNLTYKEALKAEAAGFRVLKKNFPKFYEKTILERVHLSTSPLESLVHSCWTSLHEQFHIAEPVKLKVDSVSNTPIRGVIDDIVKSTEPNAPETISPNSSDKENSSSKKSSPTKKNYFYSVKVLSEVPIIVHDVPACSIDRAQRAPSKDLIRMYIRAHAMRYGPNFSGPWIVDPELVRRHKIATKGPGFQVDKIKLKQMSTAIEEEYYARVMNAKRQSNGEGSPDKSIDGYVPLSFKRTKRFSVLCEDNKSKPIDREPNSKDSILSPTDDKSKKKMRQATLFQFGNTVPTEGGGLESTPTARVSKPPNPLPRVAQHLIKLYSEDPDNQTIPNQIKLCAKFLSDSDVFKLPSELRERVRVQREIIAHRKKLLSMSPIQRKAYLRETREKEKTERLHANRLRDDQEIMASLPNCPSLPEPSKITLSENLPDQLFGRLLGLNEFFQSFVNLLIEGSLDDSDAEADKEGLTSSSGFTRSPLESLVPGLGESGYSEDEDDANTEDEEEEAALTESTARLPSLSIRALRRLGIHRLCKAVAARSVSAGAYRSLARPLSMLLRLLLRDDELGKRRELGIKLAKLPVTPYTAPELLRLTLLRESGSDSVPSDHAKHIKRESSSKDIISAALQDLNSDQNPDRLAQRLGSADLHDLDPENRVFALETAVEKLFDFDLIDDHILACQRHASDAWQKKIQVLRSRNLKRKEKKDARDSAAANQKKESTANSNINEPKSSTTNGAASSNEPTADLDGCVDEDLASIVKRRRMLAARAAAEREEKENLERERRAIQAQECAEERAVLMATRAYELCAAEARCALRCQPIGYDRYYRRFWYFRSAPDRLFVESNWATPDVTYSVQPPDGSEELVNRTKQDDLKALHSSGQDEETSIPPSVLQMQQSLQLNNSAELGPCWSTWFVYNRPEQLDQLVGSLLERGIRESKLKRQLLTDGFLDSLKTRWKTNPDPGVQINTLKPEEDTVTQDSGKALDSKQKLRAETALAGALLKNILDTEVRLRSGGLGGVPDFVKWQERLAEIQTSFGIPEDKTPIKNRSTGSRNSCSPAVKPDQSPDRPGLVRSLIDVAQNIMPRFLNVPDLTVKTKSKSNDDMSKTDQDSHPADKLDKTDKIDDDDNDSSSDENSDNSDSDDNDGNELDKALVDPAAHESRVRSWLAKWCAEVQEARTLTRLNLLHACLDTCIRWEKSVEDARCRVCRRKTDDDNLLLCDGCNLAFHLYCLRPPLRRVPAGDWFCPTCRPASRALEERRRKERLARSEWRRRRQIEASSDEEDDGDGDTDEESSNDTDNVSNGKRLRTVNSKSTSHSKTTSSPANHTSANSKAKKKNDSTCLICSESSDDLLICSSCPNAFHLTCHEPPVHHIPRGSSWVCTSCRHSNGRSVFSSQRLTREARRSTFLRYCKKKASSRETLHQEDANSSRPTRPQRSSRASVTRVAELQKQDESQSETDSVEQNRPSTRRRTAPNSAGALSRQCNNRPAKRRRLDSSEASESSSAESQSEDESSQCSQICARILDAIYKNKNAWPFREPVDKEEVPDYYEIITDPIDLSMLRDWLSKGRYDRDTVDESVETLIRDLGTMFYNAELYNAADSDVWIAGNQLEKFVKNQIAHLGISVTYSRPALGDI